MKLTVYASEQVEKKVALRLIEEGDAIKVVAVDENGEVCKGGYLLSFVKDGTILINGAVNKELGFQLTSGGEIVHG